MGSSFYSIGVRTTHSLFIYLVLPFNKEFSTLHELVLYLYSTCIIFFGLYKFTWSISLHLILFYTSPLYSQINDF